PLRLPPRPGRRACAYPRLAPPPLPHPCEDLTRRLAVVMRRDGPGGVEDLAAKGAQAQHRHHITGASGPDCPLDRRAAGEDYLHTALARRGAPQLVQAHHPRVTRRGTGGEDQLVAQPTHHAGALARLLRIAQANRAEDRAHTSAVASPHGGADRLKQLANAVRRVRVVDQYVERRGSAY